MATDREVEAHELSARTRALASALRQGKSDRTRKIPLRDTAHETTPLSFAQERLWFLERAFDVGATYHVASAVRLTGPLNIAALQRSVQEIVRRHEILRTRFVAVDGSGGQLVDPAPPVTLPVVDLSHLSSSEGAELSQALLLQEAIERFDLQSGPLWRASLLKLAPAEHILRLTQHHLVTDGWSTGVFWKELAFLYAAFVTGQECQLPALQCQYADYALWQRAAFASGELDADIRYWKEQLRGATPALLLADERRRPRVQAYSGSRESLRVPAGVAHALGKLAGRSNATLYMALMAALQALLSRWARQTDILVGSPVSGRSRGEIDDLLGFFVNLLVIRTDCSGNPRFTDLLEQVRRTVLGAFAHQELPLAKLIHELNPVRDVARQPLFQVEFNLQHTLGMPWRMQDLARHGMRPVGDSGFAIHDVLLEPLAVPRVSTKFDLSVQLGLQRNGDYLGAAEYSTALFDGRTIARLLRSLEFLLEQVAANPEARLAELQWHSPQEQSLTLRQSAAPARCPADNLRIAARIAIQAQRIPFARAVRFADQDLSYRELEARSAAVADYLVARGAGPDRVVAVIIERSLELVVSLLGVLKAGAAFLPIDSTSPTQRLRFMVEDSRAALVLTCGSQELPLLSCPVLRLGDIGRGGTEETAGANAVEVSPDCLAYVIYTSGSTGRPKGVAVSHRAIENRLEWMQRRYALTSDDRVLQKTPIGFDVAVWEVLWPLCYGGQLVIARPEGHRDPQYLRALVLSERITIMHFVPAMLREFLKYEEQEAGLSGAAPQEECLRHVICSGEVLGSRLCEQFFERHRSVQLHNLYGPTEAAVDVSSFECEQGVRYVTVPIGRPVSNTQLYVLNDCLQLLPTGVAGELYIGGVQVARGYLNRPALTAERFVANPFTEAGGRLYRTGDLARYDETGDLEYIGRIDQQVKIRGLRIELGEIEATLRTHSAVKDAAVVAQERVEGESRLVAYVVAERTLGPRELRDHLRVTLPEYMLPNLLVQVDSLPRTSSGKVDRRSLPAVEPGDIPRERSYAAPRTPLEETLAAIWSQVLGIERVGRDDNFFELGGHSLLAIHVLERLRRLHLRAEASSLFLTPVLAEFAATLRVGPAVPVPHNAISAEHTRLTPEMLPLVDLTQHDIARIIAATPGGLAAIQDIYALSPLQHGILFHHQLAAHGDPYLIVSLVAFAQRELLDRYLSACQRVVDRHDVLRTAFHWNGLSTPVQVVRRRATLSVIELMLDPKDGPVSEQLQARFDPQRYRIRLSEPPLLRFACAFDATGQRWLLLHLAHHLIGDHSTSELLHKEVRAFLDGRADTLAAPTPFRNLIAEVRAGVSTEDHERFFRTALRGITEPTTPFGLLDVRGHGDGIVETRRMLQPDLSARLRAESRRIGASVAAVCHLAWALVLSRTTGRLTVVFGTVLFGRMQATAGIDSAMGLFMNTLPLRLDLEGVSVVAAVEDTRARLADLMRHEHASLSLAQRCSGVKAGMPLFSTLLNYRHIRQQPVTEPTDAALSPPIVWLGGKERTNYPLTLAIDDFGEALALRAQVATSVNAEQVCSYVVQALESLVHALEHAPEIAVQGLEVVPNE